MAGREVMARFWEKVNRAGPVAPAVGTSCWIWTAAKNSKGYGVFRGVAGRMVVAHRVSFAEANGVVPVGMDLDHLCRVRHCVNPAHLEAVSRQENVRRGVGPAATIARAAAMDRCRRGHSRSPVDTKTCRRADGSTFVRCLSCCKAKHSRYRARQKALFAEGAP
jgi:hypothetical protein